MFLAFFCIFLTPLTVNFPFSEKERTRKHAKYPKPLQAYAATYKVSIGTISSWIRRGKLEWKLPPLPDRVAMAKWLWCYYGTRRTAGYRKRLAEYAIFYATTTRSIKRWIRRGKQVGELPPLDDAEAMPQWLAQRMRPRPGGWSGMDQGSLSQQLMFESFSGRTVRWINLLQIGQFATKNEDPS